MLRSAKGSLWNPRLPWKGKFREVLEDHPGLITALTKHNCWRTRVLMPLGERSEILLGVRVSPLSHTLTVRTKSLLNLACRGDVKSPHRRDTLTRPSITATASCYLSYNLLSTQFVHLLHTPHISTFHQRTPHKTAHSGDKLYQTNSLKLIWYS